MKIKLYISIQFKYFTGTIVFTHNIAKAFDIKQVTLQR